jgi:ElaB/YqjD/DUF883 family membrane-anchored ribosome-binding protein
MAATDVAPNSTRKSESTNPGNSENIEEQISRLQEDIRAIAASVARLSGEKVSEARDTAKGQVRHVVAQGRHAIDDVAGQATALEDTLKETIRERPLTAVAGAIGLGFLLALMSRR